MIALCDMRAFYASAEAVFQPGLRQHNKIAVMSSNDGAIISLTEEAKRVGVKKFEPYFKQRALCQRQGVEVFSANFELYGHISQRIMDTLGEEVPMLEQYSIDEAFCDVTGVPGVKEFAQHLKSRIWKEQRIPMGVSIGATKTLAKLGQGATKKYPQINGVCLLETEAQRIWLARRTPVNDVWGIGNALTRKLGEEGILDAFGLMRLPLKVARRLGGVNLEKTVMELNGVVCFSMESEPVPKQQIIHSRSFGTKTNNLVLLKQAVADFTAKAAEKLRRQDTYAGQITVWLSSSPFDTNPVHRSGSSTIPGGTGDTRELIKRAMQLLDTLYCTDISYAKAGVSLMDIRPVECWPQDLFTQPKASIDGSFMKVMDLINETMGKGTVFLAIQGNGNILAPNRARKSNRYFSSWAQIPVVRVS